jgi:hypothetical protein
LQDAVSNENVYLFILLYKEMKNLVFAFKFFKLGSSDERNEVLHTKAYEYAFS